MALEGRKGALDAILDQVVEFLDGSRYERLQPLTDFRKDPGEARILYSCKRIRAYEDQAPTSASHSHGNEEEFVMKVKVQIPAHPTEGPSKPMSGPSENTAAELEALQKFCNAELGSVPHLVSWKRATQGQDGLLPSGYITYTVMTKMPGNNAMELRFWSMTDDERKVIREAFVKGLKSIWALGIAPYDCALRNVLWDDQLQRCSIVDFEHWRAAPDPVNMPRHQRTRAMGTGTTSATSNVGDRVGSVQGSSRLVAMMTVGRQAPRGKGVVILRTNAWYGLAHA